MACAKEIVKFLELPIVVSEKNDHEVLTFRHFARILIPDMESKYHRVGGMEENTFLC